MEKLSIEEKAKRYDEGLEIAKKNYISAQDLCEDVGIECFKNTLENIFPELKESENELSWLTRYIEEDIYILSMDIRDNEDRVKLENLRKSLAWLAKQGKQVSVWNEEDIFKVQRICKYLNEAKKYYADITEVRECIDWLKSLKERIGEE